MRFKTFLMAAALAVTCTMARTAEVQINDAYLRVSNPMAAAAFLEITNLSDQDDRLIALRSEVAARVELHAHREDANGVMQMIHLEEGIALPAGATHALKRGGDHVMFMGLTHTLEEGEAVPVTFVFEQAGEVTVEIPVDQSR
ncbi:copper chaperone PCu(A)C [Arenibacterium sp. LLYu02]|uniref:copper chaperone PCu(A)C n=1 Tax=Arenibacterium sp. LLYu02 TaxID=3404132 RepID=UPI003B220167